MRVLIVIHGFPPTHYAGAERAGERIAHWLNRQGHSVDVFAVEKVDAAEARVETQDENGITIHRVYYDIKSGDNYFRNTYEHPFIAEAFRKLLSSRPFDIVHLISGYLVGGQIIHLSHSFGIPVVVTVTEYWFMCARLNLLFAAERLCVGPESDYKCARCVLEDKRRYRIPRQRAPEVMTTFWQFAERLQFPQPQIDLLRERRLKLLNALNAADLVICPSHFIYNKFAEYGFDTRRFTVISHGLDGPPSYQPPMAGAELRLAYIGQIKPHKGVDLVVKAVIAMLEAGYPVTLDIWGNPQDDSDYSSQLEQDSQPYTEITWRGRFSGEELWNVLSTFDVQVVPSRWYENFPTVILQAFKVGIPVVATNLGGMAEMVLHDHNGLLFELNNVDDLRQQLERLIREPYLYPRLQAGIPVIKSGDEEVQEIFEQYTRLLTPSTIISG